MTFARFLDLAHTYLLLNADPKEHDRLNQVLIGPLSTREPVDPLTGMRPPSWWHGDEHASRSSVATRATLRRQR